MPNATINDFRIHYERGGSGQRAEDGSTRQHLVVLFV